MLPIISFMITLAKNNFQDYKTFRMKCNFSKLSTTAFAKTDCVDVLYTESKTQCTLKKEPWRLW